MTCSSLENGHILLVMLLVTISVSTVGALEPTLPQYWLTESYTTNPILIGLTFSGWAAGYTVMMPFVSLLSNWIPSHTILFLGMIIIAVSFPAVKPFS